MVTKEIKQFVISQMKEANWHVEKNNSTNNYHSRHLNIEHYKDIQHLLRGLSQKTTFSIKVPSSYGSTTDLEISRKELGINFFYFHFLLRKVKKSCKLEDKRRREAELSRSWKKFLDKNKDLKRDNRINQIID
jgi:hypothetical protein